jgi:hypothetical protein
MSENVNEETGAPEPNLTVLKDIISAMMVPAKQFDPGATLLTVSDIHQRVEEHVPESYMAMDVYLALKDLNFPQVPIETRFYYRVKPL